MSKLKKYTSPQPRCPNDASRYVVDYMDYAPVWPAVIFAQGLFRPTQNGAPVVPLEIEYRTTIQKQRVEYVFRSPEALNIVDQAVALHLCQLMAAGNRVHLSWSSHLNYLSGIPNEILFRQPRFSNVRSHSRKR